MKTTLDYLKQYSEFIPQLSDNLLRKFEEDYIKLVEHGMCADYEKQVLKMIREEIKKRNGKD